MAGELVEGDPLADQGDVVVRPVGPNSFDACQPAEGAMEPDCGGMVIGDPRGVIPCGVSSGGGVPGQ